MPQPKSKETLADYVSRFLGSSEAKSDFPKKSQRLAVAYSMFKRKREKKA